jgi:hypothetical protein
MKPDTVFDKLTPLTSRDVLVINNYHGLYSDAVRRSPVVIYTCFGEVFNYPQLKQLLEYAPDTIFFIITARKYLKDHNKQQRCYIFYLPSCYGQYADYLPENNFDIKNKSIKKRFLSLNYRAQWNRLALTQFLNQENLIEHFYFSYHGRDRFGVGRDEVLKNDTDIIGQTWFNNKIDRDKLLTKIPFVTGIEDTVYNKNDWGFGNEKYYSETFCSFVNETYIDENTDPFFTEKIFKPIMYGHPFLVFSSSEALKLLGDLGFETFGDVFDESYDQIENPHLRFEHLLREVQKICSMPLIDIEKMQHHLIPKLLHNRKHLQEILPHCFQKEMQHVIDQIKKIILANNYC